MLAAREIDRLEEQFTARGEAFFHVSGTGHEAVAALASHLKPEDWLHCHYRDKALMLARGVMLSQRGIIGCLSTPMDEPELDTFVEALEGSLTALGRP